MERRTFLRGLLINAAAGTALVKLASEEDVRALALNQPILIGQPEPSSFEAALHAFSSGDPVYVQKAGRYHPIGIITEIRPKQDMIDVGSSWSGQIRYIPGLRSAIIHFEGDER